MDIVLIRHGRTDVNEKGCFGGSTDTGLSIRGIKEVENLKLHIKDIDFDCIYASPMIRALQTVKILGFDYIIDDRLREIDFGIFEGLSYKDIEKKYPKEYEKWNTDYLNYRFINGESLMDVFERACDFLRSVDKNNKRILIVTHGGVIRCILSEVFKSRDYFYKFKIDYAAANIISYDDDFMFIKGINCISNIKNLINN
ncbi:histidine phosphatase family protein [Caloramator quimbayensis]|uniref:histidine phosphatase family protein n=1 Tax=Caloramator quimbayensis TaxID=1147123 RepID=UPI0009998219|nr:histidine phosphatase family protein [Caloramator quimbayensis]